jgi:cupin 2 domain-containing protein
LTTPANLLADLPRHLPEELFTTLLEGNAVRIERNVSHGHASAEGFWYDQEQHEWVLVVQGAARLRFEAEEQPVELRPGDWLNIPAHKKHRVEWTTPDEPTVWLAVHYGLGRDPT